MEILGLIIMIVLACLVYEYFYYILAFIGAGLGVWALVAIFNFLSSMESSASTHEVKSVSPASKRPSRMLLEEVHRLCNGKIPTQKGNIYSVVENQRDPDGRTYTLEYQSTPDGNHAIVICRKNPWGKEPNAGVAYGVGHVSPEGFYVLEQAIPAEVLKIPRTR